MSEDDLDREFLRLSRILTKREVIDPTTSARCRRALLAADPAIIDPLHNLITVTTRENFTNVDEFEKFSQRHPELRLTALAIIRAWYLGYAGTPAPLDQGDNAQFVSYERALMFEPTRDATVIPTYARGGTDYWREPPNGIAHDKESST
ncbi:sugar dehydrogenase complex small subunit [Gluconacetobacter tumulicola]|uniref:Uncharacterized protein n=1 Tax=Gluconacetobacter tumulicola TaxID=1017177 RepID=A0A7W4P9F0_9PROT|nr:sugar dehydrogenase complex small subunit [Gluconacetobacter tumulicola]MBB2180403.1 hypothetical protein [Gluconacetobacter tumulicola]